jgi:hypothetical protein
MPSIPSLFELQHIFFDERACLAFLIQLGIFSSTRLCSGCGNLVAIAVTSSGRAIYRCGLTGCRVQISGRTGSFFANSKLPCSKIMLAAYLWLGKSGFASIQIYTGFSTATVAAYTKWFRQLVADNLEEQEFVVGGDGIIVEVDESKLGKRKYHRGHHVEGVWVCGGVERTPERRVFLKIVTDRSKETLHSVLSTFILPGSIIYTDLWKGYGGLETIGFEHLTVNHSQTFRDPETGVCTNAIEGTWNGLKLLMAPRQRTKECEDFLWEFIWRRSNEKDLWNAFCRCLIDAYYQ